MKVVMVKPGRVLAAGALAALLLVASLLGSLALVGMLRGGRAQAYGKNNVGSLAWFFAEGSTAFPFQQWYLLVNPSAEADATATLTFFVEGGAPVTRSFRVPGQGRISIFTDLFLPQAAVSTRVSSDRPIVVERSMYFGGGNGGHNTISIPGS